MKKIILFLLVSILVWAHPVRKTHNSVSDDYTNLLKEGYDYFEKEVEGIFEIPKCLRVWVRPLGASTPKANYEFLSCSLNMKDQFTFGAPISDRTYKAILTHELGHAVFTTMAVNKLDSAPWKNFKKRRRIERIALSNKRRISEIRKLKKQVGITSDELSKLNEEYRSLNNDPIMKEYREVGFKMSQDLSIQALMTPYTELFADLFGAVLFNDLSVMQDGFPENSKQRPYRTFEGDLIDIEGWKDYGSYSMFLPVKHYMGQNFVFDFDLIIRLFKILDEEMSYICSVIKYYPKANGEFAYQNDPIPSFLYKHGLTSEHLNRRLLEKLK